MRSCQAEGTVSWPRKGQLEGGGAIGEVRKIRTRNIDLQYVVFAGNGVCRHGGGIEQGGKIVAAVQREGCHRISGSVERFDIENSKGQRCPGDGIRRGDGVVEGPTYVRAIATRN